MTILVCSERFLQVSGFQKVSLQKLKKMLFPAGVKEEDVVPRCGDLLRKPMSLRQCTLWEHVACMCDSGRKE